MQEIGKSSEGVSPLENGTSLNACMVGDSFRCSAMPRVQTQWPFGFRRTDGRTESEQRHVAEIAFSLLERIAARQQHMAPERNWQFL